LESLGDLARKFGVLAITCPIHKEQTLGSPARRTRDALYRILATWQLLTSIDESHVTGQMLGDRVTDDIREISGAPMDPRGLVLLVCVGVKA